VVIKKPQPFLMSTGDVFVYPTSQGHCINSYFPSKERIPNWRQDGWSVAIIVEAGHTFEFLAWYRPLVLGSALSEKPELADARSLTPWVLRRPGPFSATHFKRMELEKIGTLPIDFQKLERLFPERKNGTYQVVNDISLVNELSTGPYRGTKGYPVLSHLPDLLQR
jgi:hypothetical protein